MLCDDSIVTVFLSKGGLSLLVPYVTEWRLHLAAQTNQLLTVLFASCTGRANRLLLVQLPETWGQVSITIETQQNALHSSMEG